jgi:hypothetical protein
MRIIGTAKIKYCSKNKKTDIKPMKPKAHHTLLS